jgi:predicted GNAT family acetyltransferase
MFQVVLDSDLSLFLRETTPFLELHPQIHSFLLSLVSRLERTGKFALAARAIDQKGLLVCVGLQTDLQYPLVISVGAEAHARNFAEHLSTRIESLPGVNGPLASAQVFAEQWQREKRCALKTAMDLRLFELSEVITPPSTSGRFRVAETHDVELIFKWLDAFHEEAVLHDPKPSADLLYQRIRDSVLKGYYFIWEDQGSPVCLVGSNRETQSERWVAPVYTPPELRGRGYASSLVHRVSKKIVESGKRCMLFTDLSNPTSNSIYQKVGYLPIADFRHVLFL